MWLRKIAGVHPILATSSGQVEVLAAAGFKRSQVAEMGQQRKAYVAAGIVSLIEHASYPVPESDVSDDPLEVLANIGPVEKASIRVGASAGFEEFLGPVE